MDYGGISSSISSSISTVKGNTVGISSNNFNGFWQGDAHDNLTSRLTSAMSNLNTQLGLLGNFASALNKLQEYKEAKEKIKSNESEISRLDKLKDSSRISSLESENTRLKTKMESLKSSIESIVNSITPFSTQETLIGK